MDSPRETSLNHLPRSGDKLVDWIFKQFVFFLRKETLRIKRKKRLMASNDPHRQILRGLLEIEEGSAGHQMEIFINPAKGKNEDRDAETSTLIHELCHLVFWKTWERFIPQLEDILFDRFTTEQKNYIKSFIPRHEVRSA